MFLMLQMTRGWTAPETAFVAKRTAALAEKSGKLSELGNSLWTRGYTAFLAADLSTADALANEALELALREGNPTSLASRYLLQVMVRFWRGDLVGSEEHFLTGLKFFSDLDFRRVPTGPVISALGYGSLNAWMRGQADLARERMVQMMAAVNPDNPHHVGFANLEAATLRVLMREYEHAQTFAARAAEVCEKHRLQQQAALSRCLLGRARVHLGRTAEGVSLIRNGIVSSRKSGWGVAATWFLALLAEAQQRDGAIADALATIRLALDTNCEEVAARPEISRIQGELWLSQNQMELADAAFRESIALARNIGAKAWELRATSSLARLLDLEGRRSEGRSMLAEIYSCFTEGFDTPDLKDAKSLLEELGA